MMPGSPGAPPVTCAAAGRHLRRRQLALNQVLRIGHLFLHEVAGRNRCYRAGRVLAAGRAVAHGLG